MAAAMDDGRWTMRDRFFRRRKQHVDNLTVEPWVARFDMRREARSHFLQEPAVAMRVAERGERGITLSLRLATAHAIVSVAAMEHAARVMARFADLHAPAQQVGARLLCRPRQGNARGPTPVQHRLHYSQT